MARTPLFHWLTTQVRSSLGKESATRPPETDSGLTRRQFLKRMAATTAALTLTSTMTSLAEIPSGLPPVNKPTVKPIPVIGAGLGGLVTAYRLTQQGIPCEVYEASARVGGRVFTHRHFNREGMFVELGGELVDTGHTDLIALCEELKVPLERFAPFDEGLTPALYFSEGKIRSEAEIREAFQPLAEALRKDIQRCFPDGEIMVPTWRQPYKAQWLDRMTLEYYLDSRVEVAPWLSRLIKSAYTGEYGLDPRHQSALNLLILIGTDDRDGFHMFGISDEAMRIQGGGSVLVEALTDALRGRKVPIHTRHALTGIRDLGDSLRLTFRGSRGTVDKTVGHAVLALPFSVLRNMAGLTDLPLSTVKKQAIAEWSYGTNSKQMIGFRSRLWRRGTDSTPAHTGELCSDWSTQCYWETSRLQAGEAGILTNFLGGEAGQHASDRQWEKALADLSQLYPQIADEADGNRIFFNWGKNPWALGSYSCPRPGHYTTLVGAAGEPELGGRLFFAGEHCSVDWAGYMNGAIQSGNQVVEAIQLQAAAMENIRYSLLPGDSNERATLANEA